MQDAWRAYLELAMGLAEAPRKKAQDVVRRLVGSGGATAAQLQALGEELVTTGAANREALTKLVRFEVDRTLGAVGLATADEVAELTRRVHDLERQLREARAVEPTTASTAAAPTVTAPTAAAAPANAPTAAAPTAAAPTVAEPTAAAPTAAAPTAAAPTAAAPTVAEPTAAAPATAGGTAQADPTLAARPGTGLVPSDASAGAPVAKKAVAKKAVAKKAVAKKAVAKKPPATTGTADDEAPTPADMPAKKAVRKQPPGDAE
ncbi:phasin family protein [Micromonospora sp. DT231]|uniref:phasin family protein n=1 Tax=Micromonospora sp. DT231 TaxID=3416526 RepID=UPI003CFAB0C3